MPDSEAVSTTDFGHALVAHDVPLGGVDQVDLEVAVAELVHEVISSCMSSSQVPPTPIRNTAS